MRLISVGMNTESQLRIRNLTEHAHDYQEKVAAVHQSQHLLLGTIRELLEGIEPHKAAFYVYPCTNDTFLVSHACVYHL